MTVPDLTPAEQWHAASDHAKDGEPLGGPLCNCQSVAARASALGWQTTPDAARARRALADADAAATASRSLHQQLTAIANVYAQLAIADALSRKPDDLPTEADRIAAQGGAS